MHLLLHRSYGVKGVNGELYLNGALLCYTIELPWNNNVPNRSCIPEGTYRLQKRWSPRHLWHLEVCDVPGRQLILVHPANYAMTELRGCIAPVTILTGEGSGSQSRPALEKLLRMVMPVLKTKIVLLTITCKR